MSLDYVFDSNPSIIEKVQSQGFDYDSIIFLCKEFFSICGDIALDQNIIGEFIRNLKTVYDFSNGKKSNEEENEFPTRVTVTNTQSGKVYTLNLLMGSNMEPFYVCNFCTKTIKQGEIKSHVIDHESF
ncbi:hypothetical protein SteCoe_7601 [Stentor coeruleus]|uniref:Uncharacterized protein n=1 Tax=Stentor coeruleus TaxID=5963 RepID=A0A1R2CM66_9CILI|nr:hypothetical protein SteCoe_7601 [Stentor coeruleus]